MKLVGVQALGILGGIVFISLGSLSFLDSAPPTAAQTQLATPQVLQRTHESSDPGQLSTPHSDNSFADLQKSNESSAETTLRDKIDLLEQGLTYLSQVADYTAKIQKQEVVGNELLDEHTILIKCRHKPFSVYLNWITGDSGREVIFVEGRNNGKMIAHDGGWKSRIPAFSLNLDSRLAMRDARYPVNTAGLLGLIEIMLEVHREDLTRSNLATCIRDNDQEIDGRACETFTVTYKSPSESPLYRKSITFFDLRWHVPIQSRHFEWPRPGATLTDDELDESTLIESYKFTEIQFQTGLTDDDFDRKNPEYRFR